MHCSTFFEGAGATYGFSHSHVLVAIEDANLKSAKGAVVTRMTPVRCLDESHYAPGDMIFEANGFATQMCA